MLHKPLHMTTESQSQTLSRRAAAARPAPQYRHPMHSPNADGARARTQQN